MMKPYTGEGSSSKQRCWRVNTASIATSLLAHSLLLLGLRHVYRPMQLPRSQHARSEITYVDLVALQRVPPPLPASSRTRQPAGSPESSLGARPLARDSNGGAGETTTHESPIDVGPIPVETAPAVAEAQGSGFRSGYRDSRLYVDVRALRPAASHPAYGRLEADTRAAIQADQDSLSEQKRRALAERQIAIFGRRITVLGDSSAHHRRGLIVDIVGRRATMPEDGRAWEDLQMSSQRDRFVRDSILRERIRATRERRNPAPGGRPRD